MLNNIAALLSGGAPAVVVGDYDSIATANGTGSSGVITFTSISSSYKHLQIRLIAKDTGGVSPEIGVTFNSDTAANYSRHRLTGNGTAAAAFGQANTSNIPFLGQVGLPTAASTYGVAIIDVLDYSNTNIYKTLRVLSGQDSNGSGGIDFTSGSWRNTAAISTVTVSLSGSNYTTASSIALYGIK
jgi:hypothetical protein